MLCLIIRAQDLNRVSLSHTLQLLEEKKLRKTERDFVN